MPTYDYRCDACGHAFELWQGISEKKRRTCPRCRKPRLVRLVGSGGGLIFRGSGFYETDYKRKRDGGAAAAPAGAPAADGAATPAPKGDAAPAPAEGAKTAPKAAPAAADGKPPPSGGSKAGGARKGGKR